MESLISALAPICCGKSFIVLLNTRTRFYKTKLASDITDRDVMP